MAQSDLLDILKEVRGTGPVNGQIDSGIYYEIAINPAYDGHDGMYGHIVYIYSQTPALEAMQQDIRDMYAEIAVTPINGNAGLYGDIVDRHDAIIVIQNDITDKYTDFLEKYNTIDLVRMEIVAVNIDDVITVADNILTVNAVGTDLLDPDSRLETIYDGMQDGEVLDFIYEDMTSPTYSNINNSLLNAQAAKASADEADAWEDLSQQWAENEEDIPVNNGANDLGFSSKHYSRKTETLRDETQTLKDETQYLRNELSELSVTANTLPEGAEATVEYTFGASLMQFGIPKGETGPQGLAGLGVNILGSDIVADILLKDIQNIGDTWIATDTGFDSDGLAVIVGDMMRAITTGVGAHFVNIGPVGVTGYKGDTGASGVDGIGWTNGYYDPASGVVIFDSSDGLGFNTADLRGQAATISAGVATSVPFGTTPTVTNTGDNVTATFDFTIPKGASWTNGTYNAATGIVTFNSNDGLTFSTDDLRGADGLGWKVNPAGEYDPASGVVTFLSDDGLGFATGDLRGATGPAASDIGGQIWNDSFSYLAGALVTKGKDTFMAKIPSINADPYTDAAAWLYYRAGGREAWNTGTEYMVGSLVTENNSFYISMSEIGNVDKRPSLNPALWELYTIDNLNSTAPHRALSAGQGKILNETKATTDATGIAGATPVGNQVFISSTDYNLLGTYDSETFYIITS